MAQALLRRRVLWAPQILTEVRRFGKASLANRIMEMQLKLCTERWVLEFRRRIFQYLLGEFLDSGHPGTTLETPTPARSSFRLLVSLDAAALVSYHLRSRSKRNCRESEVPASSQCSSPPYKASSVLDPDLALLPLVGCHESDLRGSDLPGQEEQNLTVGLPVSITWTQSNNTRVPFPTKHEAQIHASSINQD